MSTEWVSIDRAPNQPTNEPQLTIYADRAGYLNSAADNRWFTDAEKVTIVAAANEPKIGFTATTPDDETGYTLRRETEHGATVALQRALETLGIDEEEIVKTLHFPLEEQGEYVVADLSDLTGGEESGPTRQSEPDTEPTSGEVDQTPTDDSEGVDFDEDTDWLETVGPFSSETRTRIVEWVFEVLQDPERDDVLLEAREIADEIPAVTSQTVAQQLAQIRDHVEIPVTIRLHSADKHDDWERSRWEITDDDLNQQSTGDDPEPLVNSDTGRDAGTDPAIEEIAHNVTTLREFADAIEKPVDRARTVAMDHDVYSELSDNPGAYGRGGK